MPPIGVSTSFPGFLRVAKSSLARQFTRISTVTFRATNYRLLTPLCRPNEFMRLVVEFITR
jgi:hypothetical protein